MNAGNLVVTSKTSLLIPASGVDDFRKAIFKAKTSMDEINSMSDALIHLLI